jgi:glycosyltransferase involved in cell wall biosynthesis
VSEFFVGLKTLPPIYKLAEGSTTQFAYSGKHAKKGHAMKPTFSIITPTFNAEGWIRGCVASVADQAGVTVEHIVQDGGSKDGTAEYVLREPRVLAVSKPDKGMYDAVNQGFERSTGEFVLHLNADEELLPGALLAVGKHFQQNPSVDVVLTGTLMCNADGTLNCYRKPLSPPLSILLTSHHPVQTCSIFFRRSLFADRSWFYDPRFRYGSDVHLMIDIVRAGKKIGLLDRFTSVFFLTGTNMGLARSVEAEKEYAYQLSLAPAWMRRATPLIRRGFHLRQLLAGHYTHGRLAYELYVAGAEQSRQQFVIEKPTGIYQPY